MIGKRKEGYFLAVFLLCGSTLCAQNNQTFSMPDSVLLIASPYHDLRVVSPDHIQVLLPPVNVGQFNPPSIAPRGDYIAWGFAVSDAPRRRHPGRFTMGIYSIAEQKWRNYGEFDDIGAAAFSPDGSKVAFVAEQNDREKELLMLDVATGKISAWEKATLSWSAGGKGSLGWSPDGKRLAVELQKIGGSLFIGILDLDTGNLQPVGDGFEPAWSPTGEWIAYIDPTGEKCMLVHPDGTGTKIAKSVGGRVFGHREFAWGLVWSPDGKKLLLNEVKGDGPSLDVLLLDLESGRVTRKSRNGLPAYGWVAQHK